MNYLHTGFLTLILILAGPAYAETTDVDAIGQLAEEGQQEATLPEPDGHIGDSEELQARFLEGLSLLEQNDIPAARAVFAEITQSFPRLPEAHNNLAVIYAGEGDYVKAQQALLNAAAQAPDYATVQANLGDLHIKMAVDAYRKTLELNPDDSASQAKLELIEQLLISED